MASVLTFQNLVIDASHNLIVMLHKSFSSLRLISIRLGMTTRSLLKTRLKGNYFKLETSSKVLKVSSEFVGNIIHLKVMAIDKTT